MISMKFATFLSLFQLICIIFGHFMVIWNPRLETEFRRIFEKSLASNGLSERNGIENIQEYFHFHSIHFNLSINK